MKKQSIFLLLCFYFSSSHAMFKDFNSFATKDPKVRTFIAGLLTGVGADLTALHNKDLNKYFDTFAIGLGGITLISLDNANNSKEKQDWPKAKAINYKNKLLITIITEWCQQHSEGLSLTFYYAAGFTAGIALGDVLQKNVRDAWEGLKKAGRINHA